MNAQTIISELSRLRCRRDEMLLQADVAAVLKKLGLEYIREPRLDAANRIDFLIDSDLSTGKPSSEAIGIECKTSTGSLAIARQIYRYAEHLPHIILVTAWPLTIKSELILNSRNESVQFDVIEIWKNL